MTTGSPEPLFYLGTHKPRWLWSAEADFPLFVSHRTLSRYAKLKPATSRWALDSGGFSELSTYGTWTTNAEDYVRAVARYEREIGHMDWAAPQDWMCEPAIINGGIVSGRRFPGTHLSVSEHQARTVANFIDLTEAWRDYSDAPCPFIPVLQGWDEADYLQCAELYAREGVGLADYPVTGVGTICRRQGTQEIGTLITSLSALASLHAFGVKTLGLLAYGHMLKSADSMSWSFDARYSEPMPGHTHKSCSNCLAYATAWRQQLLGRLTPSTASRFELAA
jgi:hypothetical protein